MFLSSSLPQIFNFIFQKDFLSVHYIPRIVRRQGDPGKTLVCWMLLRVFMQFPSLPRQEPPTVYTDSPIGMLASPVSSLILRVSVSPRFCDRLTPPP